MTRSVQAAIVLAGGAGSRLGGTQKPQLTVAGSSLLDRALRAVAEVASVVVVGPPQATAVDVAFVRENPPGGGPAAAVTAGLASLPALPTDAAVVLLAADLPAITPSTIHRLAEALRDVQQDGAVLADADGREQLLISVWRSDRLRSAAARRPSWDGAPLRTLLQPLSRVHIAADGDEAADVDTPEDLARWS